MPNISQKTKKLIEEYKDWHRSLEKKEGVSTIHVDEVASKVAAFYEKIRGIVDWKEEHLMKRAAIERKLKRRVVLIKEKAAIAEPLILELIRGGHFPNDQIKETKINEVEKMLDKYIYIIKNSNSKPSEKQKIDLYNWLLSIAACEVEEVLSPSQKERALLNYMAELMSEKIKIQQRQVISIGEITEEEKNRQIYIACQRALFKLDSPIITYHLLKKSYTEWKNLSAEQLQKITQNIYSVWEELEKELNHPLKDKFYKICEKYDTPYLLFGDILSEKTPVKIDEMIANPELLEGAIRSAYNKRLSTLKKRLSRATLYSTLSIFLTDGFSFFIFDIPLARLIMGEFSYLAIAVNILGPSLLMYLLLITIEPPSKNNLEVVLVETMKIVYQSEKKDFYEIRIPREKGLTIKFIIAFLYLISAGVSLGAIIYLLRWAGLPPTSYVVNVMFVALIAFTGLAIRNKGEELTMEEKKVGFFNFIFDILFLPIVGLGHWLSNKWKKYNAISVFFNALIDFPFQTFIEFLEQWRHFLKEKKEEIY